MLANDKEGLKDWNVKWEELMLQNDRFSDEHGKHGLNKYERILKG